MLAVALAGPVVAEDSLEVIRPTTVATSTSATDFYPAVNLINGSGLSATPTVETVSTVTHAPASTTTAWVTAASGSDWFAIAKPPPVLTFGLPGDYTVNGLAVWGYAAGGAANNNEAKTLVLEFSEDGGASWTGATTLTHARTARASETLEFASHRANAVRITITDNHFGSSGAWGGDRVGLGEVRFLGTPYASPVPVLTIAPGAVDFGNHPATATEERRSLQVTNGGSDQPLVVSVVSLEGPNPDVFRVESAPVSLDAGVTGSIELAFRPQGRRGRFAAWLRIESNDPDRPRRDIGLVAAVEADGLEPAAPPVYSHPPGTFADPIRLNVSTTTPGALLMYSLDDTVPGLAGGQPWREPLWVTRTSRFRAATVVSGQVSEGASASYIRISEALRTKTSPLPIVVLENFGSGPVPDKGWTTNTQTGAGLRQVHRQPVVMSLHDRQPGSGRATMLGASTLQTRGGLRVRGAFSSTWSPQPYSFESWGMSDRGTAIAPLGLPPESDWIFYHPHPSYDATLIFNTYIWELSRRTGRYAPAFRHVEVYVNEDGDDLEPSDRRGLYALVEQVKRDANRLDVEPLSADGTTGGWVHSINRMDPEPEDGFPSSNGATTPQFFRTPGPNRLLQTRPNDPAQIGDDLPRQYNAFINFEDPGGYEITAIQRAAIEGWFREFENVLYDPSHWRHPVEGYRKYLDTRDFIDYFQLLNLARQGDGLLLSMFPWVSSGPRRLHMGPLWDFNNGAYHLSGAPNTTLYFRQDQLWYPRLFADPEFLMEYIDRWFELRRGPYATESLRAIADGLAADITAEMANSHGLATSTWNGRLTSMKNFLVQRANWIDTQYIRPPVVTPSSGAHEGPVVVSVAHHPTSTGALHVTLDGSDPRAPGGAATGSVYTEPISLAASAMVNARTRTSGGQWSGLATATFIVGQPASAATLVVSELHYNPPGAGDAGEFLEIMNISERPIDLTGAHFDRGIQFAFPTGTRLGPGERAIIAARASDFDGHPNLRIIGEFAIGSRLDNGGETLRLRAWDESVIVEFAWDDAPPWPGSPDGDGPSLTLIAPPTRPDPAQPWHWRPSTAAGGSPGSSDARPFAGDPLGDRDGDGINNLCAYALGLELPGPGPRLPEISLEDGRWVVRLPIDLAAEAVAVIPEWSADLLTWAPVDLDPVSATRIDVPGGRSWLVLDAGNPPIESTRYLRVRAIPR